MMYDLFMFHSLQCTMVNSSRSVAGSSLLFTFIEIMEAIFKKNCWKDLITMRRRSRELSTQMAAIIVKHERAKEFHL